MEEGRELRGRLLKAREELEGVRVERERLLAEVRVMREIVPTINCSSGDTQQQNLNPNALAYNLATISPINQPDSFSPSLHH